MNNLLRYIIPTVQFLKKNIHTFFISIFNIFIIVFVVSCASPLDAISSLNSVYQKEKGKLQCNSMYIGNSDQITACKTLVATGNMVIKLADTGGSNNCDRACRNTARAQCNTLYAGNSAQLTACNILVATGGSIVVKPNSGG